MPTEFGPTPLEMIVDFLRGVFQVPTPPPPHAPLGNLDGLEVLNFVLDYIRRERDTLGQITRHEAPTAINTNTDAGLEDVKDQAQGFFTALSEQIAAAAGGPTDPALLAVLAAIAERINALWVEQTGDRGVGIPGTVDDLNQTIFDVSQVGTRLDTPISKAYDPSVEAIDAADDALLHGTGGEWQVLIPAVMKVLMAAWRTAGPPLATAFAVEVLQHFPRLLAVLEQSVETLAGAFGEVLNRLHRPMEIVVQAGAGAVLRELRDEMFNLGPVTPDNVDAAAARLLGIAGGFGMAAHLAAVTAEKIHPTKHLGFPQMAAYLADAASFGSISRNSVGAQVEAALQRPARRRALAQFRPELPDPGSFVTMLHWRQLADFEWANYWREHGWTEADIARIATSAFRAASPRELAMVFEDGDVDQAWALTMLQRAGFNDDDAARLLRGVMTRGQKSVRQAFVSAVGQNAAAGLYAPEEAAGFLRAFGLSEPLVQQQLEIEAHKRVHTEVTERVAALVSAHVTGAITEGDLLASFAALGLDQRAQVHHVSVARIKRGAKVFAVTDARDRASEDRARHEATEAALAAFRRFTLSEAGLAQTLLAIGVSDAEVDALVALASVQRTPAPRLEELLTPGAEAQKARQVEMQAILALLARGQLTPEAAVAQITELGIPRALAASEVSLVLARLVKPPDVVKPPTATELERERQRELTNAAVELFRAGLRGAAELRAALVSAGHPAANADAIVTREVDRREAEQHRRQVQLADVEFRREQTAVVDEALAAFRAGLLDAAGLEQTLVAAGLSPTVAAAMVKREQDLLAGRSARREQSAAEREAARVLQADEDAAVFAFRQGILTADELEALLVDAGTPAELAHALRRREEARRRTTGNGSRVRVGA